MFMFNKNLDLTIKYYDLWGATLMNLVTQAGIDNVVDASIIGATNSIMLDKVKTEKDLRYYHNKLMETRL